jgi:hypothetical protein
MRRLILLVVNGWTFASGVRHPPAFTLWMRTALYPRHDRRYTYQYLMSELNIVLCNICQTYCPGRSCPGDDVVGVMFIRWIPDDLLKEERG